MWWCGVERVPPPIMPLAFFFVCLHTPERLLPRPGCGSHPPPGSYVQYSAAFSDFFFWRRFAMTTAADAISAMGRLPNHTEWLRVRRGSKSLLYAFGFCCTCTC